MTQRAVRSVSDGGNVPSLRFLWEVAGMFLAAPGAEGGEPEAAAAKSVKEKLGLYEEPRGDEAGPDGDVESEESQPEE